MTGGATAAVLRDGRLAVFMFLVESAPVLCCCCWLRARSKASPRVPRRLAADADEVDADREAAAPRSRRCSAVDLASGRG